MYSQNTTVRQGARCLPDCYPPVTTLSQPARYQGVDSRAQRSLTPIARAEPPVSPCVPSLAPHAEAMQPADEQ